MSPAELASAWRAAIHTPELRRELEDVYTSTATEIAARGPACWASGRCCNFDRAGHRLYVTGLEAAYCVEGLRAVPMPAQTATLTVLGAASHPPRLTRESLEHARALGGCPFQLANLCGVHAIKPLGCRVYFCDQSAQRWQEDLSERMLARIKSLHERHHVEYRYGEWRGMLEMFL